MKNLEVIYLFLGGAGIFIFGMNSISNSLQTISSELVKKITIESSSNFVYGFLKGVITTITTNNSYVTILMFAGLVNASIVTTMEGLAFSLGANLGTSLTTWIFFLKLQPYSLLLISLSVLPYLFFKNRRLKQFGSFLFALGLVFLGMNFIQQASELLYYKFPLFLKFDRQIFYPVLFFISLFLSMFIKSSSALLGIIIAIVLGGFLDVKLAIICVMGMNLGEPIGLYWTAKKADVVARRVLGGNLLINLVGVIVIIALFKQYVIALEYLIPGNILKFGQPNNYSLIFSILFTHTLFNIFISIFGILFIKKIELFIEHMLPGNRLKETHHLALLGEPGELIPSMAIIQAEQEMLKLTSLAREQFDITRAYLYGSGNSARALAKIKELERSTDDIKREVGFFLSKLMQKNLTPAQSATAQLILRVVGEIENISDYLDRLATYHTGLGAEAQLSGDAKSELLSLFDEIIDFYISVVKALEDRKLHDGKRNAEKAVDLRVKAQKIRATHIERIANGNFETLTAVVYSDIVLVLKKVRSHCQNISQAIDREIQVVESY